MNTSESPFPSGVKMAAAGGLIWLILLCGVLLSKFWLSIFELLCLLAPWVVVPLTLSLMPAAQDNRPSRISGSAIRYLLFPGAVLATASFFLRDRRAAGALTVLWLRRRISPPCLRQSRANGPLPRRSRFLRLWFVLARWPDLVTKKVVPGIGD